MLLAVIMTMALFALPVFAADDENLEDMPTTVDETATASEPAPAMPEIKKAESTYFGVVDIWADYTTISFSRVNDLLGSIGAYPNGAVTKMSGGYALGVDLGFTPVKGLPLDFGLRVELIGTGQGKYSGDIGSLASTIYTIDSSLIPVMAGASYNFEIPETPVSISAEIHAGYSFAKASVVNDSKALGVGDKITEPYSGSAFACDLGMTINYQLNEPASVGLNLGYRLADVTSVSADSDIANTTIKKGDTLKNPSSGSVVPFDFSGFNAGVKVDMKY